MSRHLPQFNHITMLTNYDLQIKDHEIKIIDDYVIANNFNDMNLEIFKSAIIGTLPVWRAEQLTGDHYQFDNGLGNYKKYINHNK